MKSRHNFQKSRFIPLFPCSLFFLLPNHEFLLNSLRCRENYDDSQTRREGDFLDPGVGQKPGPGAAGNVRGVEEEGGRRGKGRGGGDGGEKGRGR